MSRFLAVCLLASGRRRPRRGRFWLRRPHRHPLPSFRWSRPLVAHAFVPASDPCHPLTLCEFANTFKPAPGSYEVWLINPVKGCPVKVCFNLPCGCPHVRVCKREIVFDYGAHVVKIHFGPLCGKLRVVCR